MTGPLFKVLFFNLEILFGLFFARLHTQTGERDRIVSVNQFVPAREVESFKKISSVELGAIRQKSMICLEYEFTTWRALFSFAPFGDYGYGSYLQKVAGLFSDTRVVTYL